MPVKKHSPPRLKLVKVPEKQKRKLKYAQRHDKFVLALHGSAGMTDHELAGHGQFAEADARMRRVELMQLGYVEYCGSTRTTPLGSKSRVWRLTKKGLDKAQELLKGNK